MKTKRAYLFLIILAAVFFAGCNAGGGSIKRIPDLTETYSNSDKKPFGAYIAFHQLEEMFYRNTIRDEKENFDESWKYNEDTGSIYICIVQSLFTTDEDVDRVINFVKNGNDAFFAVQQFDYNLMDKLECKVGSDLSPLYYLNNKPYGTSGLRIKAVGRADTALYQYFYRPFCNMFSSFNAFDTRVLGVNEKGDPDFIVIFKGKGRIFLHCEPRAFSNYFLLQKNNYEYFQKAFGYLKSYPDHVYWDDYYIKLRSKTQAENRSRNRNRESFSSLDEIMNNPPLATAFWLTLILLLVYILFGMKRRQRMIEMIKPNENTTVTFTETIGRLYLQKKDNKNIADKMITYFNEYIRNNYFLNTSLVNKDFLSTLSRKSGVPFEKVETLYRAINHAQNSADINDYELLSLNEQIQNFYKKTV